MKSIKEKSEEYLQQEKNEILCVYDRYAGFVDGANYVLETIEDIISNPRRYISADTTVSEGMINDIVECVNQLKSNQ